MPKQFIWFVAVVMILPVPGFVPAATLKGGVRVAEGEALQGIFVTARDTVRGVAVSVVSDGKGRFSLGFQTAHVLTAHGAGFVASSRPIAGNGEDVEFVLQRSTDPVASAPASALVTVFPEGPKKRKLIIDCMGCHQFNQRIVFDKEGQLLDHAAWAASTVKMISFSGPETNFPILPADRLPEKTADWVSTYLNEQALERQVPAPATIEGAAAAVTITEYDFPKAEGLPFPDLPHDLMLDGDGQVLITGMFSGSIYSLNPVSGEFTANPIPTGFANPRALDIDPAGNWWVVLGMPQKMARYTPTTEQWDFFDIGMYAHSVMLDKTGRVWFNGHFTRAPEVFGYLDAASDTTRLYQVPPGQMSEEEGRTIPYGLRVGPDGTVWGTELAGNRLIRFSPVTEEIKVYDMPSAHSGPRRLDIGRDGTVWIPEYAANKLARFDPAGETFTEYDFPTANSLPYCARIDHRRGRVWVSQPGNDGIASFDIAREEFVEYRYPSHIAFVRHLDIDLESGQVWGAYAQSPGVHPKIVRLDAGR